MCATATSRSRRATRICRRFRRFRAFLRFQLLPRRPAPSSICAHRRMRSPSQRCFRKFRAGLNISPSEIKPEFPKSPSVAILHSIADAKCYTPAQVVRSDIGTIGIDMELSLICNLQSAFSSAPPAKQPVGYITDFAGLGLTAPLANDLTVFTPLPATGPYVPLSVTQNQANVVGVIEKVGWGGGQNDPLMASCYMSEKNAALLKQSTLET